MDTESQNALLIKNLPKNVEDILTILQQVQPQAVDIKSFGRRRALLSYATEQDAVTATEALEALDFGGRQLNVAKYSKVKPKENVPPKVPRKTRGTQTKRNQAPADHQDAAYNMSQLNKYVRKLYACDANLNFEQPPPPYLLYDYPKINADILDAISIALMSNTRFYTQVLHLMNRMNLEPPFGPRAQNYKPPGKPKSTATQTDDNLDFQAHHKAAIPYESELETSGEDEADVRRKKAEPLRKRKLPCHDEQFKKKARQILHASLHAHQKPAASKTVATKIANVADVFEQTTIKGTTIALQIKQTAASDKPSTLATPLPTYSTTKLTLDELQALPIYKNYQLGEPSNKLYIKNLAKDVTQEELERVFLPYVEHKSQLDIKLMQQGRMKGQAFVTFCNIENAAEQPAAISRAVADTNGLILKQKPMIVCYGKQQSS